MATRSHPILQGSPKSWFMTPYVPNQSVGEVDPYFVVEFFQELGNQWRFIDVAGIDHHVDFNGLTTKPCVTNGWNALGNFYQWNEVHMLTLFYYGQNTFLMLTAPAELDTSDFPSFHSMSTQLCHDHSYLVFINENNYNSSELVLSRPFGHFLMAESTKSEFKLCGPLGHIVSCKLLIDLEFKLGEGWTTFCQLNNIQPGNRLTFNMHETLENNVIIVKQM
ncbi:DNA helicase [Trifolium repens]|nr:DNA helicase [Trifolium repens]